MEIVTASQRPEKTRTVLSNEPASVNDHHVDDEAVTDVGVPLYLKRSMLVRNPTPAIQRQIEDEEQEEKEGEVNPSVQAKLTIGAPDDEYEREADEIADCVMRMPNPNPNLNLNLNPNPRGELDKSDIAFPRVQTKLLNPISMQSSPTSYGKKSSLGSMFIQTKPRNSASKLTMPNSVKNTINSPEGGSPLNETVRSRVEPVLGTDLSAVRVHSNASAQDASQSLNALAFTHQNNVFLGKGQSASDTKLMAHELTHVAQQTSSVKSDYLQPNIMRITDEEREEILDQMNPEEMLGEEYDEDAIGPVDPVTTAQAQATLQSMRTVVGDVHRDLNTVLHMVNNLEGMESTDILTWDFLVYLISEALDAGGVMASEENEGVATIITRTLKVILDTWWKIRKIKQRNAELEQRNATIMDMFDMLVVARTAIDDMMVRVETNVSAASILADIGPIARPSELSAQLSANIEFIILKLLLNRKGAALGLRTTDQLNVNTDRVSYTDTEHYRVANSRHDDSMDNWFLYGSYQSGWLPFHPFADTAYSWKVLVVEGVPEEIIRHVLTRMNSGGIPKERLYSWSGEGDLTFEERMGGTLFQVDVIED